MTYGRQEFFNFFALAVRASNLLVAKDKDFELLGTFRTEILKDRHLIVSLTKKRLSLTVCDMQIVIHTSFCVK